MTAQGLEAELAAAEELRAQGAVAHSGSPEGEPYVTTQDDETLLEWWNGTRKLSVYIDDEGIRALKVGPGKEIVDVDLALGGWATAREWLAGKEAAAPSPPDGPAKVFGREGTPIGNEAFIWPGHRMKLSKMRDGKWCAQSLDALMTIGADRDECARWLETHTVEVLSALLSLIPAEHVVEAMGEETRSAIVHALYAKAFQSWDQSDGVTEELALSLIDQRDEALAREQGLIAAKERAETKLRRQSSTMAHYLDAVADAAEHTLESLGVIRLRDAIERARISNGQAPGLEFAEALARVRELEAEVGQLRADLGAAGDRVVANADRAIDAETERDQASRERDEARESTWRPMSTCPVPTPESPVALRRFDGSVVGVDREGGTRGDAGRWLSSSASASGAWTNDCTGWCPLPYRLADAEPAPPLPPERTSPGLENRAENTTDPEECNQPRKMQPDPGTSPPPSTPLPLTHKNISP